VFVNIFALHPAEIGDRKPVYHLGSYQDANYGL